MGAYRTTNFTQIGLEQVQCPSDKPVNDQSDSDRWKALGMEGGRIGEKTRLAFGSVAGWRLVG